MYKIHENNYLFLGTKINSSSEILRTFKIFPNSGTFLKKDFIFLETAVM